jgi:hypothetical protein
VYGCLALAVPRLSLPTVYILAGALIVLGYVAVLLLETAPYERQTKAAKTVAAH